MVMMMTFEILIDKKSKTGYQYHISGENDWLIRKNALNIKAIPSLQIGSSPLAVFKESASKLTLTCILFPSICIHQGR